MNHQKPHADATETIANRLLQSFSIDAAESAINASGLETISLETTAQEDPFCAALTALPPTPAITPKPIEAPRGRDRRAHPRHESGSVVAVLPLTTGPRPSSERTEWLLRSTDLRGQLVDVSMTGLAMHLSQPLERDSTISLRVSNPRFDYHVDCTARVLRSEHDPEEGWNIVCRFERSLTFQQLHQIGRHLFASTIV